MAIRDKAILEVTNLRKTYGSTVAVDDVSFSVEEGEVFGILGPTARARRPPSSASRDSAAVTAARSGSSATTRTRTTPR